MICPIPSPCSLTLNIMLLQRIKGIMASVTIPVMAKCRIGHFAEAQILQSLGADFIDESEGVSFLSCDQDSLIWCFFCCLVLTPADDENHIDKSLFTVPFVCGARNLGEALRRISEGAAMIRTKGEAGTGKTEMLEKQGQ